MLNRVTVALILNEVTKVFVTLRVGYFTKCTVTTHCNISIF